MPVPFYPTKLSTLDLPEELPTTTTTSPRPASQPGILDGLKSDSLTAPSNVNSFETARN